MEQINVKYSLLNFGYTAQIMKFSSVNVTKSAGNWLITLLLCSIINSKDNFFSYLMFGSVIRT